MANNRELSQFANVVGYDGGNIGIGTATPTSIFDVEVATNTGINFTNVSSAPIIDFKANSVESAARIRVNEASGGGVLQFATKTTGGTITERLRIDSSGRILQGLTSAKTGFFNDNNAAPVHQIQGSTYYTTAFSIFRDGSGASGPNFILAKGREAIVQDNDILGTISFQGHDGTTELIEGASIATEVDGTPGANDVPSALVFKTNSGTSSTSERLRIASDGRIGINETSPDQLLHIKNNASAGYSAAIKFESSGTSNSANDTMGLIQFAHNDSNDAGVSASIVCKAEDTAGNTYLQVNNGNPSASSERLRISSTGQIGMGKAGAVTPNGNSPLTIQESDSNSETICLRATNSGGNGSQPGIVMKTAAGGHIGGIYCDVNSDYMRLSTSGTDRVIITNTGNVGINQASPNAPLSFNTGVGQKIEFYNQGSNNEFGIGVQSSELRISSGTNSRISFYTNGYSGNERLRIDSNGDVVLGYNGNSLYFQNGFNNSNSRIQNGGASNNANLKFYTRSSGTEAERLRITSVGEVRVGSAFSVSQAGVVTATEFHGDASNLTNLPASGDSNDITASLFI